MENLLKMSPAHINNNNKAVLPRSLNWQLCKKIDHAIWCCPEIRIDIRWSKNRFSAEPLVVHLQGARMANLQKAFEFLKFICQHSRLITKLSVNIEVSDKRIVNALFRILLEAKNIRLEEIRFRRRYVGQQFQPLVDVIKAHSKTLKVVGTIGLGEAMQAFNEDIHLERCSLMNFDLIENGEMESSDLTDSTRTCIRRIAGLGATFRHLSMTAYSDIQISRYPMLYFLKACQVSSLRLTMQKGVAVPAPNVIRPLLEGLRRLELVGQMDVDPNTNLELIFPNLEHYDMHYVDLATGVNNISSVMEDDADDDEMTAALNRERAISEAENGMTGDYDNDMQQETMRDDISHMTAAC